MLQYWLVERNNKEKAMKYTVYGSNGHDLVTTDITEAFAWGRKMAELGIITECRDEKFDHVFTMGEQ